MAAKPACIYRNKVFSGHINNQLDGEPPDADHLAEPPAAGSFWLWQDQLKTIRSVFIETKLRKIIYSFACHPIFSHLLIKDANVNKCDSFEAQLGQ